MKAVHVWVPTPSPGKEEDLLSFRPITKSEVYTKNLGTGAPNLEAKQPLQQNGLKDEERWDSFILWFGLMELVYKR